MSIPFSRSTRSLNADSYRRSSAGLIVVLFILAAWSLWLFMAKVSLYEVTDAARLEVDSAAHSVESSIFGRVIATNLVIGRDVKAGDVLVELDYKAERLQLDEEQSRIAALSAQLNVLRVEAATENQSFDQTKQATPIVLAEARAKYREAETAARLAVEEVKQLTRLYGQGLVSELVLLRGQAEAEKTRSAADALRLTVDRLEKDQTVKENQQQVGIERLRQQAASIEGEIKTRQATIERLRNEIDRRFIRAPADGKLGQVAELRIGGVVREGEKLGVVLPSGSLRLVAEFLPASALGRIKPGQPARFRLEAFPWAQYGGVSATVANVASEPREGRVRVELVINPDPSSAIPFQHGLPGTVEIEVERASPATLMLRAAGRGLTGTAAQPRSGEGN